MKKNVMMRVASLLMVCVLATTCGISGTFAKYVTSGDSIDAARVAKFGVNVVGYTDMFAKNYIETAQNDAVLATVASSTADDVVAPGTQGTLTGFAVTGTPEVDVRVSYEIKNFTMENWEVDVDKNGVIDGEYCPIVFTVSKAGVATNYYIDGSSIPDVDTLISKVSAAIVACGKDYEANTTLDGQINDDLSISWRWYFDKDITGNPLDTYQDDAKDTSLGDRAAADLALAGTINLTVSCVVTQID